MTHFSSANIQRILERIGPRGDRPFIIVIDGPGGSGKSTLARELAEQFAGAVAVIQGDDFYADLDADYRASLDPEGGYREYFDWRRLRDQVFMPARTGENIRYQRYDWDNERMGDWVTISPIELLIVEGVYTARPELREFADLAVQVLTTEAERIRRQHARGENEDIWIQRWLAAEKFYRSNIYTPDPQDIEIIGE